jgi:uncharacterized protein
MKKVLIKSIKRYQRTLSPKLRDRGVRCLFVPSCSQYAVICFQRYNIVKALALSSWQLLRCNPINARRKLKIISTHG